MKKLFIVAAVGMFMFSAPSYAGDQPDNQNSDSGWYSKFVNNTKVQTGVKLLALFGSTVLSELAIRSFFYMTDEWSFWQRSALFVGIIGTLFGGTYYGAQFYVKYKIRVPNELFEINFSTISLDQVSDLKQKINDMKLWGENTLIENIRPLVKDLVDLCKTYFDMALIKAFAQEVAESVNEVSGSYKYKTIEVKDAIKVKLQAYQELFFSEEYKHELVFLYNLQGEFFNNAWKNSVEPTRVFFPLIEGFLSNKPLMKSVDEDKPQNITLQDIQNAYKVVALYHHPDKQRGTDSVLKFMAAKNSCDALATKVTKQGLSRVQEDFKNPIVQKELKKAIVDPVAYKQQLSSLKKPTEDDKRPQGSTGSSLALGL